MAEQNQNGFQNNQSNELSTTRAASESQSEIQSAITIAKAMPRDEWGAMEKLLKACNRESFAEKVEYSFPRGGSQITGPSVALARQAARCWGNIRWGLEVVREDETTRVLRGWAWDMETNSKTSAEDMIEKVIERKNVKKGDRKIGERLNSSNEVVHLIIPEERDMRELQNRRGAFLIRNAILQLLPVDFVEDAVAAARASLIESRSKDLPKARKKIVDAFERFGVTQKQIEVYMEKTVASFDAEDIARLTAIGTSIRDGNSDKEEYFSGKRDREKATVSTEDVKAGKNENRGHGNDNLSAIAPKATETEAEPEPEEAEEVQEAPPGEGELATHVMVLAAISALKGIKVTKATANACLGRSSDEWTTTDIDQLNIWITQVLEGQPAVEVFG